MKNNKINYFVSWSGGKDSCLSLYRAMQIYGKPKFLLTMLTEEGKRSRSHGLTKEVLEAQAKSLDIPILFQKASWQDYEAKFIEALQDLKKHNIELGVFGDIKIKDEPQWIAHRAWAEKVCNEVGMSVYEPLWDDSQEDLLKNFLDSGIVAKIVSVKAELLDANFLGKTLNFGLMQQFMNLGIDPFGEKGEFHTLSVHAPFFKSPVEIKEKDIYLKDNYYFLDIALT